MKSAFRIFCDVTSFRTACLTALALGASVLLEVRHASASEVTSSYSGSGCQPIGSSSTNSNSWNEFYIGGDDGIVAYPPSDDDTDLWIVCPITKTTSGHGISSGDEITDVEVTVNNDETDPGIYCQVVVYSSQTPASPDDTNEEYEADLQSGSSDELISFSDGVGGSGWWGTTSWLYAQLECDLQWGEELVSYEVTENGTASSQNIYNAMNLCDTEDSDHFQENISDFNDLGPAGFAEDPGGVRGFYACYTPQDYVQYAMIPANTTSDGWEWSFSSSGQGSPASWTCSSAPAGTEFAGQSTGWPESYLFPGSTFSAPSGDKTTKWTTSWLNTSTTSYVYLKQCADEGDFGIVSYRTTN